MLDENMNIIEQNKVAKELFSTRQNNKWYIEDALEEMGVERSLLNKSKHGEIVDIPEVSHGSKILHIIISPIISEGRKMGSVIIMEDITSQKVVERERNEFIVTASHEIRTPLSIIQGNLSNALDMGSNFQKDAEPLVQKAYNASNQISALFNDILIVSSIDNPTAPKPKYETVFDLNDAIVEIIDRLKPKAQEKNLVIKYKDVKDIRLNADRDEIKESIFKLVDNAIKFTAKGDVEIKLKLNARNIEIRVIDSGKGIRKDEEKRLFKKFVRLDNSLKREVGGTGLGLYIAKALAERNGGNLSLESSSEKGSTFTLVLPTYKK
jgi:signal transduction histidine kinase